MNTTRCFPMILLLGSFGASNLSASELAAETYRTYVSSTGEIRLPHGFREDWSHLGSWLVDDPKAPGFGFHDVYTQLEAVKALQSTGRFPDGTILIKEIRKIGSANLTTGPVQWAADNSAWFMMVKDTQQRFKGSAHWGEGWGWALFEPSRPNINVSKGYTDSCLGCHMPSRENDWVFLQGYPSLRKP